MAIYCTVSIELMFLAIFGNQTRTQCSSRRLINADYVEGKMSGVSCLNMPHMKASKILDLVIVASTYARGLNVFWIMAP